jgi:hypothetical protein
MPSIDRLSLGWRSELIFPRFDAQVIERPDYLLVHAVCRHGFEVMGLSSLVIIADPRYVAIGLYEALGFQRAANTWGMERRPPA